VPQATGGLSGVTRFCGTGRNGAGEVWPGVGAAGGVGNSSSADGASPRVNGPAAAVVPARKAGPLCWTVSPNNHRLRVDE
jgi:hypothetical protein